MKENERGRNRTLKIRLFPEEEELLERKARIAGKISLIISGISFCIPR